MPGWIRSLHDSYRRATVRAFPGLAGLPLEAAWARYRAAAREERRTLEPWYTAVHVAPWIVLVGFLAWMGWRIWRLSTGVLPATAVPRLLHWMPWIVASLNAAVIGMALAFQRRLKRRVSARLEAEREMGRLPECLRCGYDLRGSAGERCPECGEALV